MAPNGNDSSVKSRNLTFKDIEEKSSDLSKNFKPQWVWRNIFMFAVLHLGFIWGLWRVVTLQVHIFTAFYAFVIGWISVEATMIGAHRLFSHKSFKGTFWFKLLVVITQTIAGQNSIYIWARDHRLHHKYSDTDADPHNSSRGFFFCHMGWLLQKKHPMVKQMGKNIDMSDLKAEPLIMFQKKYYFPMYMIFSVALSIVPPVYFWNESWLSSITVAFCCRYVISLHGTWTVNSIAHLYGNRPYTKDIQPVESEFVAWLSSGEGWHNYHHTFPWDYRAAEFGKKWNLSGRIVDWFADLGLVYDLKFATPEMVQHRIRKRGDGSHPSMLPEVDYEADYEDEKTLNTRPTTIEDEDLFGEKIFTGLCHNRPTPTIPAAVLAH